MFGMRLRDRGFENKQISRGEHKGLKGWVGIGIRVDHPDPDGGIFVGKKTARGADKHSHRRLHADKVDDGLPPENPDFAGGNRHPDDVVDDGRPTSQKGSYQNPRVGEDSEKRSTSSTSSTDETATGLVESFFSDPPDWLATQLDKCREQERFVKPTCATAAGEVFGTVTRWAEVEPVLRRHLSKGGRT